MQPLDDDNATRHDVARSEGDVNLSHERQAFVAEHLDDATRELLNEDAQYFLHQSLSTPCLTALDQCEGSTLVDPGGKRLLDFHGNSAHQVGYRHPRVIDAVRQQRQVGRRLPFERHHDRAAAERPQEETPCRSSEVSTPTPA